MIAEKYKKSLTHYEGRKGAFLYWTIVFVPLFLLVMGGLNLWLAQRIGSADGFTLGDFVNIWFEEINVQRDYTYSGMFLAGMQRFNTALLDFAFAIVLSPLIWSVIFMRKRNSAVLTALRKHGEI